MNIAYELLAVEAEAVPFMPQFINLQGPDFLWIKVEDQMKMVDSNLFLSACTIWQPILNIPAS